MVAGGAEFGLEGAGTVGFWGKFGGVLGVSEWNWWFGGFSSCSGDTLTEKGCRWAGLDGTDLKVVRLESAEFSDSFGTITVLIGRLLAKLPGHSFCSLASLPS